MDGIKSLPRLNKHLLTKAQSIPPHIFLTVLLHMLTSRGTGEGSNFTRSKYENCRFIRTVLNTECKTKSPVKREMIPSGKRSSKNLAVSGT